MNVRLYKHRAWLFGFSALGFLIYTAWAAHAPGQPRTLNDFLFLVSVFGVPFLILTFSLWSLSGHNELTPANRGSTRVRVALTGSVFGASSAALLLLLQPFWDLFVEHERVTEIWVIVGMALAVAATICGVIGLSRLRRSAIASALLLPFWLFAAGLLLKAALD